MKRYAEMLLIALVCLLLTALVLRQAAFVRTVTAQGAVVAAEGQAVRAPAGGTLAYLRANDAVRQGEPLFGIETRDRHAALVEAPASGRIVARLAKVGERLEAGEAVTILGDEQARPFVRASVDWRRVMALGAHLRALIRLPDGRDVDASVDPAGMRVLAEASQCGVLDLAVDGLDPASVGRPVAVRLMADSALLRWWLR